MKPISLLFLSALAAVVVASCQTVAIHFPARDLDARVFPGDRGEDFKEVWLVDKDTGEKLESLIEGPSLAYTAKFSPSKAWLVIEDEMFEDLVTVRLFHHEAVGGFRRVPDEFFIVPAWRDFLEEKGEKGKIPVASSSTLHRWEEARGALVLRKRATLEDGTILSGLVRVDLSAFE